MIEISWLNFLNKKFSLETGAIKSFSVTTHGLIFGHKVWSSETCDNRYLWPVIFITLENYPEYEVSTQVLALNYVMYILVDLNGGCLVDVVVAFIKTSQGNRLLQLINMVKWFKVKQFKKWNTNKITIKIVFMKTRLTLASSHSFLLFFLLHSIYWGLLSVEKDWWHSHIGDLINWRRQNI